LYLLSQEKAGKAVVSSYAKELWFFAHPCHLPLHHECMMCGELWHYQRFLGNHLKPQGAIHMGMLLMDWEI
jgi:hypothetical protein